MNWEGVFKEERECFICLFWILLFIKLNMHRVERVNLFCKIYCEKSSLSRIPLSGSQSLSTSFADASSINL